MELDGKDKTRGKGRRGGIDRNEVEDRGKGGDRVGKGTDEKETRGKRRRGSIGQERDGGEREGGRREWERDRR